jgi:hypothetical protein
MRLAAIHPVERRRKPLAICPAGSRSSPSKPHILCPIPIMEPPMPIIGPPSSSSAVSF